MYAKYQARFRVIAELLLFESYQKVLFESYVETTTLIYMLENQFVQSEDTDRLTQGASVFVGRESSGILCTVSADVGKFAGC